MAKYGDSIHLKGLSAERPEQNFDATNKKYVDEQNAALEKRITDLEAAFMDSK